MADDLNLVQSGLCKIILSSDDPYDLFVSWQNEKKNDIICLSTCSSDNRPHSRHVVLRHHDKSGFVIVTDNRSRKTRELNENDMRAAICMYWRFLNDKNELITRQMRIEGVFELMPRDEYRKIYEAEPLFCKIRAHLCHQSTTADWNELKNKHNLLFEEYGMNGKTLPMPDHFIGYKMAPTWMEFYYAKDNLIGDRLEFTKDLSGKWSHRRLAA